MKQKSFVDHNKEVLNSEAKQGSIEMPFASLWSRIQDLAQLVKFRLSATVVISSLLAYLIAAAGEINIMALVILAAGGFLTTGAANTLNQVLEKDFDRLMKRTADRPLAAGRMKISDAVLAAGFMSLFGISFLALFNPWTAFFGTFALVSYAFVYTPMKRVSPGAVAIGAVPGALPTLIGCVAAQGELTALGLTLFAIQFCWQFPHFWSIAYLGYEDYSNAGYKLVPEAEAVRDRLCRAEDSKRHPVDGDVLDTRRECRLRETEDPDRRMVEHGGLRVSGKSDLHLVRDLLG